MPSKFKKLEGKWRFKEGSGFEIWELKNDQLIGYAFRITKTGDTSRVEEFVIRKTDHAMVYDHSSFTSLNDSLVKINRKFLGNKRKLFFSTIEDNGPYSVEYKFGLFSRNKLKVFVVNHKGDDPFKFTLFRIKE